VLLLELLALFHAEDPVDKAGDGEEGDDADDGAGDPGVR